MIEKNYGIKKGGLLEIRTITRINIDEIQSLQIYASI